ncbi:hypothetical protein PDESU_04526 [Pontiella desulfatans]|uniref:Uncharacterized protein n=1 Tax=Pontiella desulfatans TaxID=2750659 RepID=A0A6C2U889_PONDE|nr:hypothetical protein [Pontiella desulfatans]VGO15937.1 hypothetical protein PDESU_04526 [Pontiella desulfatans]
MKIIMYALLPLLISSFAQADDLSQLYEKAYFLETAKGQTEQALVLYRRIAATKATDENRATILNTLDRMRFLYSVEDHTPLQAKVDGFDMKRGTLDDVTRVFGEPNSYVYGQDRFTKDNLPTVYVMLYPEKFTILMKDNRVEEFRFEGSKAYDAGGIRNGISLDDALKILGQPKKTIRADRIDWEEDTLYLATGGKWAGQAYLAKNGLRLFFKQDVLFALYVTDNTIH